MKYLDLGLSDMHKAFLQMRLVCLLMIILPGTLWAQNTKISGQVIDDTGEPVIGATVRLKGAMTGTVTDLTGGFVLQVSDMKGILEFSFVGMETLEVPIKGKTMLKVTMKSSSQLLDEVQVVAYGTQKKITLTGSVSC